jgi:hypothetical protein
MPRGIPMKVTGPALHADGRMRWKTDARQATFCEASRRQREEEGKEKEPEREGHGNDVT